MLYNFGAVSPKTPALWPIGPGLQYDMWKEVMRRDRGVGGTKSYRSSQIKHRAPYISPEPITAIPIDNISPELPMNGYDIKDGLHTSSPITAVCDNVVETRALVPAINGFLPNGVVISPPSARSSTVPEFLWNLGHHPDITAEQRNGVNELVKEFKADFAYSLCDFNGGYLGQVPPLEIIPLEQDTYFFTRPRFQSPLHKQIIEAKRK